MDIEKIRSKLARRRGVDIPTAKGQRVLLIPRTVIDNKHRDTHFIVILSNAGFFEFSPRELGELSKPGLIFRMSRAGFPIFEGACAAIAELLYQVFNVTPKASSLNLPALTAGSTQPTTNQKHGNARKNKRKVIRER